MESIFKDSPVTSVVYTEAGPLVTLRGSGQKTAMRVKVLLDGVSINTVDDSMGVIPFNAIPVTSIEKIEIIDLDKEILEKYKNILDQFNSALDKK